MWKRRGLYLGLLALAVVCCQAQTINAPSEQKQTATSPQSGQQLPVNWLYGAYVPTEAPLESQRCGSLETLCSHELHHTRHLHQNRLFYHSRSDQGCACGMATECRGFRQPAGQSIRPVPDAEFVYRHGRCNGGLGTTL